MQEPTPISLPSLRHRMLLERRLARALHEAGETREDPEGTQLVAYVAPRGSDTLTPHDLRTFLAERLPEYMLPSVFVVLDRIQRNPNGKIDRRALPQPVRNDAGGIDQPTGPRNDIERRLVTIWEELLDTRPIGVHDNFFAIGGHSLLAFRLFARVEDAFRTRLQLGTLLRNPTIAELAEALHEPDQDAQVDPEVLVPVQPRGARPPLFFVGGIGGIVYHCHRLARQLGEDQPTYGLHAPGVDGGQSPISRLEDLAATYVDQILRLRQHGPYHLIGYSLGGAIIFEMAQQLRAAGQPVGLIAMLDAPPPNQTSLRAKVSVHSVVNMLANIPRWLYDTAQRPPKDLWAAVQERVAYVMQSLRESRTASDRHAQAPRGGRGELDMSQWPKNVREVARLQKQAFFDYSPRQYDGEIVVFRSHRQPLGLLFDHDLGWSELTPRRVTVRVLPGRHMTALQEPHVVTFADMVREELDKANRAAEFSASEEAATG